MAGEDFTREDAEALAREIDRVSGEDRGAWLDDVAEAVAKIETNEAGE